MPDAMHIPSMPEIRIDVREIQRQVNQLAKEATEVVKTSHPEIRGKVSIPLKQLVREDFLAKSRGGTGADGLKWRKLKQVTIDRKHSDIIGIEFGDMLESLKITTNSSGGQDGLLEISYQNEHAEFFDETRPLLPEGDVPKWIERMEPLIEEVVTRNIQKIVDGQ